MMYKKSIMKQLSLNKLVCTRLKTKFSSYASFHVSVFEDDFPLTNPAVWPSGCLMAPFYGKLTPDQHFTPVALEAGIPSASISAIDPTGDDEIAEVLPYPTV
jgi:hypothetical protein